LFHIAWGINLKGTLNCERLEVFEAVVGKAVGGEAKPEVFVVRVLFFL
jgi:hypothetical protein